MAGFPVLSTMQGPPITDLYNTTNHADDSNALHNSFGQAHNAEFQEQFTTRTSLEENPNSWAHLLDDAMRAQAYSNAQNISFATSINHGYYDDEDEVDFLDPNGSIWPNNAAHQYSALSLATSPSSATRTSTISDVTHQGFNDRGFGAEHNSCNSKELSLSFGSQEASPWSMYLQVIQDILSQIASYSLQNFDQMGHSHSTFGMRSASYSQHSSSSSTDPQLHKQALETRKSQLLTLLQVVDDRYNQCMDEIHTVISAFHAATELDPQKHASFALRTITVLYKSMRERISSQILSMGGAELRSLGKREEDMSFEASFIQKQWALQQQKRKEHQLWRPQRGLPEKSVSVLRAWMFQNFLHPYPKDAEKHLLAMRSGLSRSQVSNWFINARVRLWKPMIEEMYMEMNKRKARDLYEQGSDETRRV